MRTCLVGLTLVAVACGQTDQRSVAGVAVTDADLALAEGPAARAAMVDELLLLRHATDTGMLKDPALQAAIHRSERRLVAQKVQETFAVTDEKELRAVFEERRASLVRARLHLAHIVLPGDIDGGAVLSRLRAGEAFEDVARAVSADAASASRGGLLPPLVEGQVQPAFFAAGRKLAVGEWSEVVDVGAQRHIIKAVAPADQVEPTFEESRGMLQAQVTQQRRDALLHELRERYEVKLGDM